MELGNKIRRIRTLKGMKQQELADIIGISVPALSKIENNATDIGEKRQEDFAKAFGMTVKDIHNFPDENLFHHIYATNASLVGYNCNNHINENQVELISLQKITVLLLEKLMLTLDKFNSTLDKRDPESAR